MPFHPSCWCCLTEDIDFDTLPHWWRRLCIRQASPNESRGAIASRDRAQSDYQDHRNILSRVSFSGDNLGDSAKNAFHCNLETTIFDAKRPIGRNF